MSSSLPTFLRLVFWMQWRTLTARVRSLRHQSRLLLAVLGTFILGYLVGGYVLFYEGLSYVVQFPVVGPLLTQRILFLIFGFFFIMLVFSSAITGYATFFKSRETAWMLSLPVKHKYVFLFKFLEALFISSWALLFLSAPLLAAYGRAHHVGLPFYFLSAAVILPFIALAAVLGSWIILLLVRRLGHGRIKLSIFAITTVIIVFILVGLRPSNTESAFATDETLTFERLLRHSRVSLHPALPGAWAARSIAAFSKDLHAQGAFYFLLITSWALAGILLTYEAGGKLFYPAWNIAASRQTERNMLRSRVRNNALSGLWQERMVSALPGMSRSAKAMLLKDFRVFWREPAQWIQFVIFFGLLCIYILNLRNLSYDFESVFWGTVISHLNLAASAMTLSTLTTRFVFPQFSLEGKRLWILGHAPEGLGRMLIQKWQVSFAATAAITVTMMFVSSVMLHLDKWLTMYFAFAIALMCMALSGLAVGLGALFPNLKEDNPSKIVSGFGGTLCLIVSFVYIVAFIGLLVVPAALELRGVELWKCNLARVVAMLIVALVSVTVAGVPMRMALRKLKTLEF